MAELKQSPKRYPALYEWFAITGHNMKWLSEQTGIGYNTLMDRMKMRRNIRPEDIRKICKATGMTEEELTRNEVTFSR